MTANNQTFNKIFQNRSLWQKRVTSIALAILLLVTLAFVVAIPMAGTSSEMSIGQHNYSTNDSANPSIILEELTPFQVALLEQAPGSNTADASADAVPADPAGYVEVAPFSFPVGTLTQLNNAIIANEPIIELTASIQLTGAITIPATHNITITSDASGPHTIWAPTAVNQRHFVVAGTATAGGSLILEDTILRGTHPARTTAHGGVQLLQNATLIMNDGATIRNNTSGTGGGVTAAAGTTVEMNGTAAVSYNHAGTGAVQAGGGVHINSGTTGGTFTMNGGTISHNTVGPRGSTTGTGGGGGLFVQGNTNVTLNDGATISHNELWSTNDHGAGVRIHNGNAGHCVNVDMNTVGSRPNGLAGRYPFTMNPGAVISDNVIGWEGMTATNVSSGGAGVAITGTPAFIMNGGDIVRNTILRGGGGGGGVLFSGTSAHVQHFTMNDGNISYNRVLGGGATGTGGGGVHFVSGTEPQRAWMWLLGGAISHNEEAAFVTSVTRRDMGGGGVALRASSNVHVHIANEVSHNRSNTAGGGFFITGPMHGEHNVYVMPGAQIAHNFAGRDGGGIYKLQGGYTQELGWPNPGSHRSPQPNILTMYGGTIAYNYSNRFGGGVFLGEYDNWMIGSIQPNGSSGSPFTLDREHGARMIFHGGEIRNNGYTRDEISGDIDEITVDGGGVYVQNAARFTATGRYASSITGNRVERDGGGIFSVAYEYEPLLVQSTFMRRQEITWNGSGPVPPRLPRVRCTLFPYNHLNINEAVVFADNFAGRGGFLNPDNSQDTDIDFPLSGPSVLAAGGQLHTLNNYDINYRRPPMALLVKTLHVPEGTAIPNASFDFYFTPVQVQLGGSDQSRPTGDFDTLLTPNPQTVTLDLSTATTATPTPANTVAVTGTLNLADLFESLEPFPLLDGVFVWNVSEVDGSSNTVLPSQMTYDLDTHFQVRVHTDSSGQVAIIEVFELSYVTGSYVVGSSVESLVMNFINTYERNIPIETGLAIGSVPFTYFAATAALLIVVLLFSKRRKAIGKISESENEFMTDSKLSEKVTD